MVQSLAFKNLLCVASSFVSSFRGLDSDHGKHFLPSGCYVIKPGQMSMAMEHHASYFFDLQDLKYLDLLVFFVLSQASNHCFHCLDLVQCYQHL